jgi:hypothetical protein
MLSEHDIQFSRNFMFFCHREFFSRCSLNVADYTPLGGCGYRLSG